MNYGIIEAAERQFVKKRYRNVVEMIDEYFEKFEGRVSGNALDLASFYIASASEIGDFEKIEKVIRKFQSLIELPCVLFALM